jgi:hypothetical protein
MKRYYSMIRPMELEYKSKLMKEMRQKKRGTTWQFYGRSHSATVASSGSLTGVNAVAPHRVICVE